MGFLGVPAVLALLIVVRYLIIITDDVALSPKVVSGPAFLSLINKVVIY